MPYIKQKFFIKEKLPAFKIVMNELSFKMNQAQRLIDKKRLIVNGETITSKNKVLGGEIELISFIPNPKGLLPIFENDDFAVFDKPSGVLSHPSKMSNEYSLSDEIIFLYGHNAHVVHRLDKETSGLIIVGKNLENEVKLKQKFENKEVKKTYLALVKGKIVQDFTVTAPLKQNLEFENLKIRMLISDNGKFSKTNFIVIDYFPQLDSTLLKCFPITGRQHQIRAHLFHVKHPIIGDTLYGPTFEFASRFLDKNVSTKERIKITGSPRLLLHSNNLNFNYKEKNYNIKSQFFVKFEFCKFVQDSISYQKK